MRCPAVLKQAVDKLTITAFYSPAEIPFILAWLCTKSYYDQFKAMPELPLLITDLDARTNNSVTLTKAQIEDTYRLLHNCFSNYPTESLNPEYGISLLEDFLYQRMIVPQLAQDLTAQRLIELAKAAEPIKQAPTSLVTPFNSSALMLGVKPRETTGTMFFDHFLGGGTRPGELYGYVAPSGGGKTTMCCQIGINVAKIEKYFVVFSYEQSTSNEYMIPVYACASGLTRNTIEKAGDMDSLKPADAAKLKKAIADIGDRLIFIDCSGTTKVGDGGADEIESLIVQLAKEGKKVSGFAVDWFLPMANRCRFRAKYKNIKEDRLYYQALCYELKGVAMRTNTWGLVTHQLTPAAAGKKGAKTQGDSAEFKSFAWYFDCTFHASTVNPEKKTCEVMMTKGRSMESGVKQVLQLDGAIATFKATSEDLALDKRTGDLVPKNRPNAIPGSSISPLIKDEPVGYSVKSFPKPVKT
jgi:hypothetical protein